MEPFSMMLMAGAGIALQAIGMSKTNTAAKGYNAEEVKQIRQQQQVEGQRRQLMELDSQRKSLENIRNVQRSRSLALTNSTSQGAQFGSGLQGGYGQISSQGNYNAEGISQNLQIGRNMFDLNAQISESKIAQANYSMDLQSAQGYSSLGKSLMGAASPFARLASGFAPGGTPGREG